MRPSGRITASAVIPRDDTAWFYLNIHHAWARFVGEGVLRHTAQTGRFAAESQQRLRGGVHCGMALDQHPLDILPRRATFEHQADLGVALNIFHFLGAGSTANIDVITQAKVTKRHTVGIPLPPNGREDNPPRFGTPPENLAAAVCSYP